MERCVLLEDYQTSQIPMQYICSCGNKDKIRFHKFKEGQRCRKCKYKKTGEKLKRRVGDKNPRWNPDRERVLLTKLMHQKFYSMVSNVLKATGKRKECRSQELLGYSRNELRDHMTSHPNWETVRHSKWSIDHIFPIKAFLDHGITDLKVINCLENLQPMTLSDNISKSGKYSEAEFLEWLNHGDK
jgi:hypothetical protein